MRTVQTLTLEEANLIADHIITMARYDGDKPVAVAVAGIDGRPIAFQAMDGVLPLSTQFAPAKARSAWGLQRDTIEFRDSPTRNIPDPEFTNITGGVVVRDAEGKVVGAIGVSGRKSCILDFKEEDRATALPQDHELAQEGLRSFARIAAEETKDREVEFGPGGPGSIRFKA